MIFSRNTSQLLARVNFPPYAINSLSERHFLVAGGGGSAKTGISNFIEIYEVINNGPGCRTKCIVHLETGNEAIMNASVFDSGKYFILFAGMEGMCKLYKLKFNITESKKILNGVFKESVDGSNLRHRKCQEKVQTEDSYQTSHKTEEIVHDTSNSLPADISCDICTLDSFQTDFSCDPFQKLSKFCIALKLLATGGADGHIRLWQYPEMRQICEVYAHKDDVDDMDFSPLGDKIISVSRDGYGKVWSSKDLKLLCELQYELPQTSESQYTYRSCRFGIVEGNKANPALFITLNPSIRKRPPSQSYLSKWDGTTFSMQKVVSTGTEMLSVMSISDDGRFIGLGTQEGSVKIYIAFSLQLAYCASNVHSIFVTGLDFLQTYETASHLADGYEASMISVSVDNHINIHFIPERRKIGILTIVFIFLVALFFIFVLMDYFNL